MEGAVWEEACCPCEERREVLKRFCYNKGGRGKRQAPRLNLPNSFRCQRLLEAHAGRSRARGLGEAPVLGPVTTSGDRDPVSQHSRPPQTGLQSLSDRHQPPCFGSSVALPGPWFLCCWPFLRERDSSASLVSPSDRPSPSVEAPRGPGSESARCWQVSGAVPAPWPGRPLPWPAPCCHSPSREFTGFGGLFIL